MTVAFAPPAATEMDPPAGPQAQVRAFILDRITRGERKVGERAPSEHELVAQFGCSRMTVHHALKTLSAEGYLTRIKGLGTFVAAPRAHVFEARLPDVAEEIIARGNEHTARVLQRELRCASVQEAAVFGLEAGEQLLHARILHLENGSPLQLEDRLVNPKLAAGVVDLDPLRESYFAWLMRNFPYPAGQAAITAVAADARSAAHLGLNPGDPCLQVERLTRAGAKVLTLARLLYPAARHAVAGEIVQPSGRRGSPEAHAR